MIVLSVAHTKRARGAHTSGGLYEYEMSQRASRAAFDSLYDSGIPAAIFEVGYFTREECMGPKQRMPSAFAQLAVEIHFNASDDARANYFEVIHHPSSTQGKKAANEVVLALASGYAAGHHVKWPNKGTRSDGSLFFLKGPTPSVIVEGLFGSNAEQAAFLESTGGPEAYGLLVAEGLKTWWKKR